MTVRFTVLASGSSGNASVLQANGFGILIDAGLGPRQLSARLAAVGLAWQHINAVVLTHTHSDHWKEQSLAHLVRRRLTLYCHPEHRQMLGHSTAFRALGNAKLIREYLPAEAFALGAELSCKAFPLSHDSGATFGFRLEVGEATVAYAADLGSWNAGVVEPLVDSDILALEFNHDVKLEQTSGRGEQLISRVLGDQGHLSNDQAAALLSEVLKLSARGRPQHLVQLHLSRECNRPALALAAARKVVAEHGAEIAIHTASQDVPGPSLELSRRGEKRRLRPRAAIEGHPVFPGWEAD